jgi:hypothetical protein
MKLPMPSVLCGVSASTAHASSPGEYRLAVSSPIASCTAAATVSPGAARTAALSLAAVSLAAVSPGAVPSAAAGQGGLAVAPVC